MKRGQGKALEEFAALLAESGNVRECALAMGVTPATGKSYFKRLCRQLGWQSA